MEEIVKNLLDKHKDDKDLTSEKNYIKPGWDWSETSLRYWKLEGIVFSHNKKKANFRNVNFNKAYLKNTKFGGAIFENAYFGGANIENAYLKGANLKGAYLRGAILKNSRLDCTCLENAEMSGTDLQNVKLWNSDLTGAKLQNSNMRNAEFNEKTVLYNANLYQSKFDNSTLKFAYANLDKIALQEKNKEYKKAKEVYKNLKNYFKQEGMSNISGEYYYREKLMETKYNWKEKKYLKWIGNMLLNLITGYGERPLNILIWWISIIFGYAFIYYFFNGIYNSIANNIISYNPNFLETLYFSINTFMTLSFGDLVPKSGFFQIFSSFEALLGAIFMALFIFVFARKMIR
jgi:uncharacterized protein YjbI with pentapeptide repeats